MSVELIEEVKSYAPEDWLRDGEFVKPIKVLLIEHFIDSRSRAALKIAKDTMRYLRYFTEFHSTNPEAMIADLESKRDLPKLEQFQDIRLQLKQFQKHMMEERGISNNTTIVAISHVRKFFKVNGYIFPFKQEAWQETEYKPLDKAMVVEALEYAESLRDKALIHVLWSSGQSAIDVEKMNRDDIREYGKWGYVVRQREKTKLKYVAPFTPECMQAVNRYLKSRKDKHPAMFVREPRHKREKGKVRVVRWQRMTAQNMSHALRRIGRRMGISKKGRKNPIRPKQFRTAFNVNLKLSGLDNTLVEYLMGHAQGTQSAYNKFPPEKVMELVQQHYNALRLTGSGSNSRFEDLEQEVAELRGEVKELKKYLELWQKETGRLVKDKQKLKKKLKPKKKKKLVGKD